MNKPRKYRRIGFEASSYEPDPRTVEIAKERTDDILHVFIQSSVFKGLDLGVLARSCYMQGLHDVVDALHQRNLIVTQPIEEVGGEIYWP